MKTNENKANIGVTIFMLLIAIGLILYGVNRQKDTSEQGKALREEVKQQGEQLDRISEEIKSAIKIAASPYTAKDAMAKTVVLKDFKNSSQNNEPDTHAKKKLKITGNLKAGYLYVRASVNNESFTQHDDVYVMLISGVFDDIGGHLITSKSIETPKHEGRTELLFDLSNVTYKARYFDRENEAVAGDWISFLNQYKNSTVLTFSSTTREGQIEELSLYYECEDETECKINVVQ